MEIVTAPTSLHQAPPDLRRSERHPLILAVEMSSDAKRGRCGVTRNASPFGLLVVTPSRFSLGERIELAVHLPGIAQRAKGRVVRVEENTPGSAEVWRYRYAIELDGALPDALLESAKTRSAAVALG